MNSMYIHPNSNHPPSVINDMPSSAKFEISKSTMYSINIVVYIIYSRLYNSGYKGTDVQYRNPKNSDRSKKKGIKKTIFVSPPLNVINKHFYSNNPINKIFIKNTLKLSYIYVAVYMNFLL